MFDGMLLGAVVGLLFIVLLTVGGYVRGAFDQVERDPEVKAKREAEQREEDRKAEWRRKVGRP